MTQLTVLSRGSTCLFHYYISFNWCSGTTTMGNEPVPLYWDKCVNTKTVV